MSAAGRLHLLVEALGVSVVRVDHRPNSVIRLCGRHVFHRLFQRQPLHRTAHSATFPAPVDSEFDEIRFARVVVKLPASSDRPNLPADVVRACNSSHRQFPCQLRTALCRVFRAERQFPCEALIHKGHQLRQLIHADVKLMRDFALSPANCSFDPVDRFLGRFKKRYALYALTAICEWSEPCHYRGVSMSRRPTSQWCRGSPVSGLAKRFAATTM